MKIFLIVVFFCAAAVRTIAQNYDESKVPPYILPDVLRTTTNSQVRNVADWEKKRRAEVLHLFEDNVYGQMPKQPSGMRFEVVRQNNSAMEGKARLKEVHITVTDSGKSLQIHLVLFIPAEIKKKAPVFLLINNRGRNNTDPTRKEKSGFWPAEMLIESGYAIAAFQVSDLAPDNKDSFQLGLLQLYPAQLKQENGTRAIGAWAWGASRVMDYFVQDTDIDASRVAVVGHSRGGKASLWAGAEDQRFAMVFSNCSGNSGAALSRRKFGETVSVINDHFPYWFTDNYKKYNDKEDQLPIDQHMLIALMAPRPVYATNASKDLWADPTGTYLSLKNAEKVYSLYNLKSVLPIQQPLTNSAITKPPIGYHNREGIHDLTPFDWKNFIKFADAYYNL